MIEIQEGQLVRVKSWDTLVDDDVEYTEDGEANFENVSCPVHMLEHLKDEDIWWRVDRVDEEGDFSLKMLYGTYPNEIILEVTG